MIKVVCKGDYKKANKFFSNLQQASQVRNLDKFGREGVEALRNATPSRSGKTADSWSYTIERSNGSISISWTNSNVNKGVNIAIILQYGHGTGTGGYVKGIDYINPALEPIFQKIADDAWKEVTKA